MNIIEKLDLLADMRAAPLALGLAHVDAVEALLGNELFEKMTALELKHAVEVKAINDQAAALEAEIKAEVLDAGQSIKANNLMAVYNKGRVTWDGKQLEGMMALIPGLAAARKEGEPTITIRGVK